MCYSFNTEKSKIAAPQWTRTRDREFRLRRAIIEQLRVAYYNMHNKLIMYSQKRHKRKRKSSVVKERDFPQEAPRGKFPPRLSSPWKSFVINCNNKVADFSCKKLNLIKKLLNFIKVSQNFLVFSMNIINLIELMSNFSKII